MPKVVDHEERREQIADALWTVVRRDGYESVSVRSVAAELGMSTGALRHYFGSQDELIAFAMRSLMERIRARIVAVAATADGLEGALAVLEEVLPLDAQRHAESEVWLALVAASRTQPALRALADESHRALRGLCDSVVRVAAAAGSRDLDLAAETDRLHALVDGLALHGTLYPRMLPRTRIRAAIRKHVVELAGSPANVGP